MALDVWLINAVKTPRTRDGVVIVMGISPELSIGASNRAIPVLLSMS